MKVILGFVLVGLLAGIVPFGLIALARSQPSPLPPVHPDQDMFKQSKFKSQRGNRMFADGRAMRPELVGVIARNDLQVNNELVDDPDRPHMIDDSEKPIDLSDESIWQSVTQGIEQIGGTGQVNGKPEYVKKFPVKVSADLLERGRERYTINCAVCHGQAGYGDGTVALRGAELTEAQIGGTHWTAPKNYHSDDMREQPVGKMFNTITNGARSMPAYAKQVSILDRWAIVAYIKALQRSQYAKTGDVPEAELGKYK